MEIWYNPKCSKCRIAREALDEAGLTYNLRSYLDEPPTPSELRDVLGKLQLEPWEICRFGDADGAGVELPAERDAAHRDEWIGLMCRHPILIQRPLMVTDDGMAYVARDPESLEAALGTAERSSTDG